MRGMTHPEKESGTPPPRPPPPKTPPPRRPFADQLRPKPFHQSREFQVFGLISAVVLGVLVVLVYVSKSPQVLHLLGGSAEPAAKAAGDPVAPRVAVSDEERAARDQKLLTLFEGSLADTSNGDGFAQTPGYHRLLEILQSYTPEDFARLPRKHLDWDAAMADPGAWRGEVVWMRGILTERYAVRLKDPVFKVDDVTQGILAEGDGTNGVFFDMINEPPKLSYREDPVDVVGIFYRTVRYPTNKHDPTAGRDAQGKAKFPDRSYRFETPEGEVQEAPYLLVKSITPVVEPQKDRTGILRDRIPTGFAVLGLAFAAGWLITYSVQRRKRRLRKAARSRSGAPIPPFEKRLHESHRTSQPPSEVRDRTT